MGATSVAPKRDSLRSRCLGFLRSFVARHPCRFFTRLPASALLFLAWPSPLITTRWSLSWERLQSPRKGTSFGRDAVALRSFVARHPCLFSLASRRASHFSLLAQRKVTKRKSTPHSRPTHSPCASGARGSSGVRRQSVRGLASNWPTSCGPSFGHSLRSLAAIEGAH